MPVLKKEEVGTAEKANGEYPVGSVIIPVYNSENIPKNVFALYLDRLTET